MQTVKQAIHHYSKMVITLVTINRNKKEIPAHPYRFPCYYTYHLCHLCQL